jgi:hypothetical protein
MDILLMKHPLVFEYASLDILHKLPERDDAYN